MLVKDLRAALIDLPDDAVVVFNDGFEFVCLGHPDLVTKHESTDDDQEWRGQDGEDYGVVEHTDPDADTLVVLSVTS